MISGIKCSARPGSAEDAIKMIMDKLNEKGFETSMTPFGYLFEFKIRMKGESLAKVLWKSI